MKYAALHLRAVYHNAHRKYSVFPSLFLAIYATLCFPPALDTPPRQFTRVMGEALAAGVDASGRAGGFYVWYLLLFPLFLFLAFSLVNLCFWLAEKRRNLALAPCIRFLNSLSIAACGLLILHGFLLFMADSSVSRYDLQAVLVFLLAGLLWLALPLRLSFEDGKCLLFLSFSLTLPLFVLLASQAEQWPAVQPFLHFSLLFGLVAVVVFSLWLFLSRKKPLSPSFAQGLVVPLSFFMLGATAFLELCNILNQYSLFIGQKHKFLLLLCLGLAALGLALGFWRYKTAKTNLRWERIVYPALLAGLAMFSVLPTLQTTVEANLFETANHGLLIQNLFSFQRIPLLESFDGHMLRYSLSGILYGLLNQDPFGAMFCTYYPFLLVFTSLLAYWLLVKIYRAEFAFFASFLLPVALFASFGLLAILCALYALRKKTFPSYLLLWGSLVAVCLYELPIGMIFSFGALAVLGVGRRLGQKIPFKKLLLSLAAVLGACLGVYLLACAWRGIPPLLRLREILGIIASNNNWALTSLGNTGNTVFSALYVWLPFAVLGVCALCWLAYKKGIPSPTRQTALLIVAGLAVSYFASFTRTLGRHSVFEMQVFDLLGTVPLALSLAFAILAPRRREIYFVVCLLGFALGGQLLQGPGVFAQNSLFQGALQNALKPSHYSFVNHTLPRVVLGEKSVAETEPIVQTIRQVMAEDETYLDFTSHSLLYALSGKENPVYINQSPGHLSGEFTQEQFIAQVEANLAVRFALLPANFSDPLISLNDNLPNAYRHYKVSEYIYQHFTPLVQNGRYAIWVRRGAENEVRDRLGSLPAQETMEHAFTKSEMPRLRLVNAAGQWMPEGYQVVSQAQDAQLYGLPTGPLFPKREVPSIQFSLELDALAAGELTIYYTQEGEMDFSEQASETFSLSPGANHITLSALLPQNAQLRLDPPANNTLLFRRATWQALPLFYPYHYTDGPLPYQYQLGELAWLWGNQDTQKAAEGRRYENALNMDETGLGHLALSDVSKEKGNYLLMTISAATPGTANLVLGEGQGDAARSLAEYQFTLRPGQSQRYLVRVSTNPFWYNDALDWVQLQATAKGYVLEDIALLEGD